MALYVYKRWISFSKSSKFQEYHESLIEEEATWLTKAADENNGHFQDFNELLKVMIDK